MNPIATISTSLFAIFVLGVSISSFADPGMDEFYKVEKNKSVFEKAKNSGQIQKGRDAMIGACDKAKAQNVKVDCECVKRVISDTSDEEFFYESMITIKIYKQTMEALKTKDQKKVEALKAEQANREGFPKILNTTCGMG